MIKRSFTEPSDLQHAVAVATGRAPADLLIQNVQVLDLFSGQRQTTHVAIWNAQIVGFDLNYTQAHQKLDGRGLVAVPGFIDGHLHIESTMLTPLAFEQLTLPLGTTTVIADPHEIANVLGFEGVAWMARCAQKMVQSLYLTLPSCVPSLAGVETIKHSFGIAEIKKLLEQFPQQFIGLGEMMNFPGVAAADAKILEMLSYLHQQGRLIDGHLPVTSDPALLNAYTTCRMATCHESTTLEEARVKMSRGMAILMREGSAAKNLAALAPLLSGQTCERMALCTDDRNPLDITAQGHINYLVRQLINQHQIPPYLAYRVASYSAAQIYGLQDRGLVAPGHRADILLMRDLEQVEIAHVIVGGQISWASDLNLAVTAPPLHNTIERSFFTPQDLHLELENGEYNVIGITPGEIVTQKRTVRRQAGQWERPVSYLVVAERYGMGRPAQIAFVEGMDFHIPGALAASIAHDAHNLIAVGSDLAEIRVALNQVIAQNGGVALGQNQTIITTVPLPLAGLMALATAASVVAALTDLHHHLRSMGVQLPDPLIQLSFLALPVIPELKLTDRGLFDTGIFDFIPLLKPSNL